MKPNSPEIFGIVLAQKLADLDHVTRIKPPSNPPRKRLTRKKRKARQKFKAQRMARKRQRMQS